MPTTGLAVSQLFELRVEPLALGVNGCRQAAVKSWGRPHLLRTLRAKIAAKLPRGSLGRRSLTSGLWSFAELGIGNAIRLASNLILTRLLLPEAFGLMAMVTTVQIGLAMLSDLGIRQSVIRSERAEDPDFLRTAWTVQVMRGAVIAALVLAVGLALGAFGPALATPGTVYADPLLPALIMVSALSVLVDALASTNTLLAHRRMDFRRIAFVRLGAQVLGTAVMVALALQWASVWALLIGALVGACLRTLLSHLVFSGPTMRPAWDLEIRTELWRFGRWIIGSSAMGFLTQHADRLILGALLPSSSLGLYMIALLWVQAYGMAVAKLGSEVGLPALSEVRRDRPSDLPRVLRKSLRALDLLCLPGVLFFLLLGSAFIDLLYSDAYHAAGQFMPLLALLILLQRFSLFSALLVAEGRSFQMMLSTSAGALAVCIAIPLGYLWLGVTGAIAGSILAQLVPTAVRLIALGPLLGREIRKDWAWLTGIVILTGLIVWRAGPVG